MSRLIDADAMNEELFYKQLGGKDTLITVESAFNMIKAQPTAYDVEKVVAELEDFKIKGTNLDKADYNWNLALIEAIEIVKKGGVE